MSLTNEFKKYATRHLNINSPRTPGSHRTTSRVLRRISVHHEYFLERKAAGDFAEHWEEASRNFLGFGPRTPGRDTLMENIANAKC